MWHIEKEKRCKDHIHDSKKFKEEIQEIPDLFQTP